MRSSVSGTASMTSRICFLRSESISSSPAIFFSSAQSFSSVRTKGASVFLRCLHAVFIILDSRHAACHLTQVLCFHRVGLDSLIKAVGLMQIFFYGHRLFASSRSFCMRYSPSTLVKALYQPERKKRSHSIASDMAA
jgi:hypothetical protein